MVRICWLCRKISTKLTNGGEKTAHGLVVLVTNNLVLAENTTTDTLDDTDLAGALVLKLADREGESTELLDNLGQSSSRARSLQAVSGGGATVESSTVAEGLDLTGAQADTHLDTPGLADLGETITSDTLTGSQDDLLLALDLVSLELPAGGVLDQVAVVALDELLEELGDLALAVRLLGTCLGDLLLGTGSEKASRKHGSQKELVGVVGGEDKVGLATLEFAIGVGLRGGNNDRVANNGTESVNLSTKLDLDALSSLELDSGLLGV